MLDRLGEAMSRKNIDNVLVPQHFVSYLELQRKKQLIKITRDNRRLLHRIQHTVPTYHPEEWERDAKRHEEYMRNMTEFPELYMPPGQRPMVSTMEGMPDRFTDQLGGGIALTNNPQQQQITAHPLYGSRRGGQGKASQTQTLRRSMGSSSSRTSPTQHQRQIAAMTQEEADAALAETEAMFRHAFHLQGNSPQPPPMPPVLNSSPPFSSGNSPDGNHYNHYNSGSRGHSRGNEDSEEDFSRNQFFSRPFLPDIHNPNSNPQTHPPGVLKRR